MSNVAADMWQRETATRRDRYRYLRALQEIAWSDGQDADAMRTIAHDALGTPPALRSRPMTDPLTP